jgi:hypothetical protein
MGQIDKLMERSAKYGGRARFTAWKKPKTHGDKIRVMTDEELAEVLWLTAKGGIIGQRSKERWLDWLREEVET